MSEAPAGFGKEILYEVVDDHIAVVTLNRPEKRNAVNAAVAEALDYAVKKTEADPNIWVCVLSSSNDKTFCAGADLAEIAAGNRHLLKTRDGHFAGFVDSKRVKPWIAAVRGSALAGGCELAIACDMIVCGEDSGFGLPEVKRGLFAAAGGVYRLPRALPRNIALELIATGDPLPAKRAYELGLVNRVAPSAQVIETAIALARAIAENAPKSVHESLRVARLAGELTDSELRLLSDYVSDPIMDSQDAKEGSAAFLEKRKPVWTGT